MTLREEELSAPRHLEASPPHKNDYKGRLCEQIITTHIAVVVRSSGCSYYYASKGGRETGKKVLTGAVVSNNNRNFTLETRSLRNQKSMVSFILNY